MKTRLWVLHLHGACSGRPGGLRRRTESEQAVETSAYGTDSPYENSFPSRQYGPQDRAGNQMQNGLPPWSGVNTPPAADAVWLLLHCQSE